VKSRTHFTGLQARLRILKALFTKPTDGLYKEISSFLDDVGHVYHSIYANIDPLTFAKNISSEDAYLSRRDWPEFSSLAKYDYLKGRSFPPEWVAEPEVSEFLGRLVFSLRAKTVVEVGCYIGVTSSYMSKALKAVGGKTKLYCIDIERNFLDITGDNLSSLGLVDGFYAITGKSLDKDVLDVISADIDLVYIDSSHDYEDTCREIEAYSEKLSKGGCLVLHDSIQWPGVRNAVLNFRTQFELMTFATSMGNGVTVMMRKTELGRG